MKDKNQTLRTIEDFGQQWLRFPENEGYYGSIEDLCDIFGPLLSLESLQGCRVAEIGSGTGRIVNMLLDAGVAEVTALEPSAAFEVLKKNTAERSERIHYIKGQGREIPEGQDFDYVFCIGVIHHIPNPAPLMKAAFRALKPGGRMLIWLYGREGNRLYLSFALPLRRITIPMPPPLLNGLAHMLNVLLDFYLLLCRVFPLPMRDYMLNKLGRCTRRVRHIAIYDQLNPTYAKYYRKNESKELLEAVGFEQLKLYHRHGYSWTVIGTRPVGKNAGNC